MERLLVVRHNDDDTTDLITQDSEGRHWLYKNCSELQPTGTVVPNDYWLDAITSETVKMVFDTL